MSRPVRIVVNGKELVLEPPCTVSGLCRQLDLPEASLLIEHNGVALLPDEKAQVLFQDNDRLEIMRIAAGG